MKRCLIAFLVLGCASAEPVEAKNPIVVIKTSKGTIKVELFEKEAPITVKNFLKYVEDKHYDGTIFHRVISDFMIQGGGFTKDFTKATTREEIKKAEKKTRPTIKNEASNGLSNKRGTIAMARLPEPDTASAQFFINVKDNASNLDKSDSSDGYCVFGKVIEGMDVVDKIKAVETKDHVPPFANVPVESVVIESIKLADK
jgi:cyclophilin family peptidyl-prolyl cis-trans isomerase